MQSYRVCVQLPTSTDNVALPAFVAAAWLMLIIGQRSTDISCYHRTHSSKPTEAKCGGRMEQIDGRTDTVPLRRPCFAYYAGTANKVLEHSDGMKNEITEKFFLIVDNSSINYFSKSFSNNLNSWRIVLAKPNKKLSYRRGTARCVVSIEILPIATQRCRNYLYDKSWPNRWYEVGDLVGGNAW